MQPIEGYIIVCDQDETPLLSSLTKSREVAGNNEGGFGDHTFSRRPVTITEGHGGAWVAVADRLPADPGVYLVSAQPEEGDPLMFSAFFNPYDQAWALHKWFCERITHWSPLPPGPEKEATE